MDTLPPIEPEIILIPDDVLRTSLESTAPVILFQGKVYTLDPQLDSGVFNSLVQRAMSRVRANANAQLNSRIETIRELQMKYQKALTRVAIRAHPYNENLVACGAAVYATDGHLTYIVPVKYAPRLLHLMGNSLGEQHMNSDLRQYNYYEIPQGLREKMAREALLYIALANEGQLLNMHERHVVDGNICSFSHYHSGCFKELRIPIVFPDDASVLKFTKDAERLWQVVNGNSIAISAPAGLPSIRDLYQACMKYKHLVNDVEDTWKVMTDKKTLPGTEEIDLRDIDIAKTRRRRTRGAVVDTGPQTEPERRPEPVPQPVPQPVPHGWRV